MDIPHTSAFPTSILPDLEHQIPEQWQQQSSDSHLGRSLGFADDHGVTGFNTNSADGYMNAPQLRNSAWDSKLSYMTPDSAPNDIVGSSAAMSGNDHFMHSGLDHVDDETSFRKMLMASPQRFPEMERLLGRNLNSHIGSTKDSLQMPGMNLGTSDCLMNFTADIGFADRAARFSPFGSIGSQAPYIDVSKNMDMAADLSQAKVVSQQHIVCKSSVPNSPHNINAAHTSSSQDPNTFPSNEAASKTPTEDRNTRPSLSPVCSNGAQKQHCTSINESDESMGQEVSSSCERINGGGGAASVSALQGMAECLGKKRKAGSRQKPKDAGAPANNSKDAETDESKSKLHKGGDGGVEKSSEPKVEPTNSVNSGESTPKSGKEGSKPPEPPKPDYIHVRARRGQATDSHSLAERVRREKISERMKYLQDLVPGCSKVTGKAVMLDEIINYVQSLQRQVEFLSMKLASVNPRVEFNIDNLFTRERAPSRHAAPQLHFAPENAPVYPSLHHNQQLHPSMQALAPCPPIQPFGSDPAGHTISPSRPMDGYGDPISQHLNQAWDELQSIVQMGYGQGRQTPLASPDLSGQLFPGQMKVEH